MALSKKRSIRIEEAIKRADEEEDQTEKEYVICPEKETSFVLSASE